MAFSSELDDEEIMSEINMTPLVDVMLVLLIIFMLTVPVLTQSVDVELPEAGSTLSEQTPDAISITVDANGLIFWNEEQLNKTLLEMRLKDISRQSPQPAVHIHGDRAARYDHVIQIMVAAQQVGLTQLGFVTEAHQ
jgi:biopolymer transport protein ExbD